MWYSGLKIKTFRTGGVHPHEYKGLTEECSIINFPVPQKVIIPLSQHIGKTAKALVKKGDMVSEYQLIGQKDGKISANVHSSIPGKVVDVVMACILNYQVLSVVIQLEGEFKTGNLKKDEWEPLKKEEILKRIESAGIVGMGGAGFPTDFKLSPPPDKKIDTLLVNGVECEPYLTSDYRLMMEKTDEIVEGIKIVKKVLGVRTVFLGIELNKKKAIKKFKDRLTSESNIHVVPLKVKYPQGGEKQLIKAILKRQVPSGGLPFDVGVIVSNIATVYAVREAVLFQKPLTERVVTVAGTIVEKCGNYKIRVGTTVSEVIKEVGIHGPIGKVIMGGPMMGINVSTVEAPVMKGTSGILFFSEKEARSIDYSFYKPCIHCSKCLEACPVNLNPSMLSILGEMEKWEDMKGYHLQDCIECGCCSFVCPSRRPIVGWVKAGKALSA
ncbi:MAG: electron transport complex subunit RsxC [Spirochaetes bacterium]|nr:electron transport complex subunit RsxC [Spirochaetota bacterium]